MTAAAFVFPWAMMVSGGANVPPAQADSRPAVVPATVCDRDGTGALLPGHREIFWPTNDATIWAMCAVRPASSSGQDGSGVELYNVYYRGHLVFKRAHAPILNVLYAPGGCGCFRDWTDSEVQFQSDTAVAPGFSEPTGTVVTVCEHPGSDIGGFNGVAIEGRGDTEMTLTAQMQAGWYRYIMRWRFYPDGKLVGWYGFAAVPSGCIASAHTHHNYWRLDFDIDGPGNDRIDVIPTPGAPPVEIANEATTLRGASSWIVSDAVTGRGYELTLGDSIAADSFAVSDLWFLRYKANEIDDQSVSHGCAININPFISGESLTSQDVVVWVRGGQFHDAGDLDDCHTVDFTLTPRGTW